jgi:hypothetical protein
MPETGAGAGVETRRRAIAKRAYALWEFEGRPHGRDVDHWLKVEAELAALGPDLLDPASPSKSHDEKAAKRRE